MRVLAETADMSREEWLELRREGLGGSDAAAVVGRDRYRGPLAVYMNKTGQLPPAEASEAMYWGSRLEDVVAEEWARRLGEELGADVRERRRNAILQHDDHDWMIGNIDRYGSVGDDRVLLECKTTGAYSASQWHGSSVPVRTYLQLQHYLEVTGLERGWIAVLIGGQDFRHYAVDRHQDVCEWLVEQEERFWRDHVEARRPPPADGRAATTSALDQLYPRDTVESAELDDDERELALRLCEEHAEALRAEKAARERKRSASNGLKALLGDAGELELPGYRVTWRERERDSYTVEATTYRHFQIYRRGQS